MHWTWPVTYVTAFASRWEVDHQRWAWDAPDRVRPHLGFSCTLSVSFWPNLRSIGLQDCMGHSFKVWPYLEHICFMFWAFSPCDRALICLVSGPSPWAHVRWCYALFCILLTRFLCYSWHVLLQLMNHQNSLNSLVINPISKFGDHIGLFHVIFGG
jgi:hypothetical protein